MELEIEPPLKKPVIKEETNERGSTVRGNHGLMVPAIDQILAVTLPSEITRATVVEVIDDDHIKCKLTSPMMGKTHGFRKDQVVGFHRAKGFMNDFWESD